jgi:hypothetical protein
MRFAGVAVGPRAVFDYEESRLFERMTAEGVATSGSSTAQQSFD